MPAERKQQADLIRHRELNALRRLMMRSDDASSALNSDGSGTQAQATRILPNQAAAKIDELEAQMNQQIVNRSASVTVFQTTRAVPTTTPSSLGARDSQRPSAFSDVEQTAIQTAAAHFANGRLEQAGQCLTQALGPQGTAHAHIPTWLALFDFYRATNQSQRFDAATLDFSIRFGRSTPTWLSIPHLAQAALADRTPAPQPRTMAQCDWTSPAYLSAEALTSFDQQLRQAAREHRSFVIDWRSLEGIDPHQWDALKTALNQLAMQPISCVAYGAKALPALFPAEPAQAVLAKLALLRCMNQAQAFEDLALDYCVAFEISPPDWIAPLCTFDAADNMLVATPPSPITPAPVFAPELLGSLAGTLPTGLLSHFESNAKEGLLVIRCDRLVRCDLAVTTELTAWAQATQSKGLRVEFKDVHRLVAAYFLAQGLYAYAKVSIRKD